MSHEKRSWQIELSDMLKHKLPVTCLKIDCAIDRRFYPTIATIEMR